MNTFNQPGSAICSITVGNETVQKRVNVVEIPIKMFIQAKDERTVFQKLQESQERAKKGLPAGIPIQIVGGNTIPEVISLLGFPDAIESVDISHPDIIGKDCVIYQPEIQDGLIYAQHFHYGSRYPGLVVFFVKGRAKIISLKARTHPIDSTDNLPTRVLPHSQRVKSGQGGGCFPSAAAIMATIFVTLWWSWRHFV